MPLTQNIQERYDAAQTKMEAWRERNVAIAATKDHLPKDIINRLDEIVMNEVNLLSDFQRLNNQLLVLRDRVDTHGKDNKNGQLAIIDMYLQKLNSLISSYEHLPSLIASINDDGTGMEPEQLLEKIAARVQSPEYMQIMDQLGELVVYQMEIDEIYKMHRAELLTLEDYNQARTSFKVMGSSRAKQRREISDFTSMPFQNLLRIAMPIRELAEDAISFKLKKPDYYIPEQQVPEKNNPKIQHLIDITTEAAERVGEAVEAVDNKIDAIKSAKAQFSQLPAKMKEEKKQGLMLRAILDLNLNSPLQNNKHAGVVDPSAYLKMVLTQAYPEIFQLDAKNGINVVIRNPSVYTYIYKAIGVDLFRRDPKEVVSVNPEKFNAEILDKLYEDTENPLWLVLKSTKPVDEQFTAAQKIQAYAELAVVFKEGKDNVAAYKLAQAALAVTQKHPESSKTFITEFGADSTLGKWLIGKAKKEERQLVISHLTLVAQEAGKKDIPSIASTTMTESSNLSSQSSQNGSYASSFNEHSDVSDDEVHYVYKDADDAASVDVSVADKESTADVDIVAEQPAVRVHDDDATLAALRIAPDTDDDEPDSMFDTDDDEPDSTFDTDDYESDSAFDMDDDESDSAFDMDEDEPDNVFDTDDDESDSAFDTDEDEPDEGVDSEFGTITSTVVLDPESYKPNSDVAAKNRQRVNQFFSTTPAQQQILYKGVDNYINNQRKADLAKFAELFPQDKAKAKDAINSHDPYFFRRALDNFLLHHKGTDGKKEVTKLHILLGSKGAKLFQLARREERFDKDYINAVINESLMTSKGPKWATRPVVPLLGPSASGKSFVKKQVLEEINNRTVTSAGSVTENGLVFSDGGIERDESRVRKLMIAFGVKNSCKDITDLDKGSSSKLKENLLNAAVLSPDLGIVIVDTASKYYHGRVTGFVSDLLPTLERLDADPKNNIIPVCIVGEDDETFGETVSFMGNSRSQAKEKHFDAMAGKAFSLMDLPENLPEFKKYQEKHRNKGINGSAFIIEALNKEAMYSINDLVLKTLGSNGELQSGGESIPGTMLVSNRIFKEWNKKTEPQKLEAGIDAAIKCFGKEDEKDGRSIAMILDGTGKWVKDNQPEVPNEKRIFISEQQLNKYEKNKHTLGFDAYKEHYSKPLMHTAGEYALFKLKKEIERTPHAQQDPNLNVVLEHMANLHIGGGPVEGQKLNRVKDSPALIDAFATDLIALEGKIPSDVHENLSTALEQISVEVRLRQLISASPDVNPSQNSKERMFYDTREFFDIKTTIKRKDDADKELNELIAKTANRSTDAEDNADSATEAPTAAEQVDAQEVVYKGDFLKNDQVIVAEAVLAPGKILHLEQSKTGKVVDRSTANLMTVEEKQIVALKQAQMLLNNYEPSKGAIVIRGRDKEQAERLYAAVLHFVKNDPEIKKRMESSRWILPNSYSPEKLIRCNIIGFVPPKTIDSGFIAKHLPIIKTLNKEQLEVLNVDKRTEVTKSIMQTNKAIDVVKTQQDYKAHVRQIRQSERPEVEELHMPTNTTPQSSR